MAYITLNEFKEYLAASRPPSAGWMGRALPTIESLLGDLDRRGWAGEGRRLLFSVTGDGRAHCVAVWLTGLHVAAESEGVARKLFLTTIKSTLGHDRPRVTSAPEGLPEAPPRRFMDSMRCDLAWGRRRAVPATI